MTFPGWRIVAASVTGAAHRAKGLGSQDNLGVNEIYERNGEPVLVAAVSDGAGSAAHSATGAATAIDAFRDCVFAYLKRADLAEADENEVRRWLQVARDAVLQTAMEQTITPRQMACTFLGAVVGPSKALFVQVGDGLMTFQLVRGGDWHAPISPQRGEYRNETFFITDEDALSRATTFEMRDRLTVLALSTDGLEDLCMERATSAPYAPFFDALFATIHGANPQTTDDDMTQALERYLDSEPVNGITGDDKTLVLASRFNG